MHNSLTLDRRDSAFLQGAMRRLFREGTGSNNVEERSDPFQGVPYLWTLLNLAASYSPEGFPATTGDCAVITKNQIDAPKGPAVMRFNLEAAQPPVVISPALILDSVRNLFGLNISETAEVFGITRQTAYQWMKLTDMEQVRAQENRNRLKQLYFVALSWQSFPPLRGRWLHEILPAGNTVLDLLRAPQINLDALQSAYQALAARTSERQREEGERATQAVTALAGALAGLETRGKSRKGRR